MVAGYIIFLVLVIAGLIIGRQFWRSDSRPARTGVIMIGITLAGIAGIFLIFIGVTHLFEHPAYTSRPVVMGRVISSEIVGSRAYRTQVVYTYTIDDTNYVDTAILRSPGFGGKRKRYEVAEYMTHEYAPGAEIPVYYSPVHPSESLIAVGIEHGPLLQLGFGCFLLFGAIGTNGFLLIRRFLRRKGAAA